MIYHLFDLLKGSDFPGRYLMEFITFRAGIAFAISLLVALYAGRTMIHRLQRMQVGEEIRNLGLEGQMKKKGTPTMGGIIIIVSLLAGILFMGNLTNIYLILMIVTTLWMGTIGFLDDYRKLKYHNKDGLKGKYKVTGQVGLGLIVGITMWLAPSIVMSENPAIHNSELSEIPASIIQEGPENPAPMPQEVGEHHLKYEKTAQTTIPFVKNNNFNYMWITSWIMLAGISESSELWMAGFSLITIEGATHMVMPTMSPRPTWPITLYLPRRPSLLWYFILR